MIVTRYCGNCGRHQPAAGFKAVPGSSRVCCSLCSVRKRAHRKGDLERLIPHLREQGSL